MVRSRTLVQARSVAQREALAEFRTAEARLGKGKASAEEVQKATMVLATARKALVR